MVCLVIVALVLLVTSGSFVAFAQTADQRAGEQRQLADQGAREQAQAREKRKLKREQDGKLRRQELYQAAKEALASNDDPKNKLSETSVRRFSGIVEFARLDMIREDEIPKAQYTCETTTHVYIVNCATNWYQATWLGWSWCDDLGDLCRAKGGNWTENK